MSLRFVAVAVALTRTIGPPGLHTRLNEAPIFLPRFYLTASVFITPLTIFGLQINRLVLETLEPLSEDRKCFRLINGVLVERTVKDVVPALKTNQEGLKKVLDDLVKQYKTKQDELDKWKVYATTNTCPLDAGTSGLLTRCHRRRITCK